MALEPSRASRELRIAPVDGLPEVSAGAELAQLIIDALDRHPPFADEPIRDGDILVVTSKIVSKAEGRIIAAVDREDAITAETVRVVATRVHANGVTRIVENRQGLVLAAAGVDASNTPDGTVLLLPEDPDASARALAAALREHFRARVGVIVSDTLGRPWREGQTDVAIGAAGVRVLDDLRGSRDTHGRELSVTMAALGDELAGAADLVKGKATGVPVAIVRGLGAAVVDELHTPARALVRTGPADMFRLGTDEAIALGRAEVADEPAHRSLAMRDVPAPCAVETVSLTLPVGASTSPLEWAQTLYADRPFVVSATAGDEALLAFEEQPADVRWAVGVDTRSGMLRITIATPAADATRSALVDEARARLAGAIRSQAASTKGF